MARRALGTKKVGHAGTLDPMATGLLVLGVGASTRLLTFIVGADKTYEATIALGASTVTDDAEGDITSETDAQHVSFEEVAAAAQKLTGDIEQVPSSVSAIKVDGVRAYAKVRGGEEVTLKSRPVTVSRFELSQFQPGARALVDAAVDCSSGTYIRALARDLGEDVGVGGHLTVLRRTRVGDFEVHEAVSTDDIDEKALMSPADAAARFLPVLQLSAEQAEELRHGRKQATEADGLVAAVSDGQLIGVARGQNGRLQAVANMPQEER